tara:strand:+ start:529 stop:732 length:204 start_codon:yes stop_codon:yes gene_type:complete
MKTRFEENRIYDPSYNIEDAETDFTIEASEKIRGLLKELNPNFKGGDYSDMVISDALTMIWDKTTNS